MTEQTPATRLDLKAIQIRVDAATPGPWWVDEIPETGECRVVFDTDPEGQPAFAPVTSGGSHVGDALFISGARSDVPALLAALAAERARAEQAADAWDKGFIRGVEFMTEEQLEVVNPYRTAPTAEQEA